MLARVTVFSDKSFGFKAQCCTFGVRRLDASFVPDFVHVPQISDSLHGYSPWFGAEAPIDGYAAADTGGCSALRAASLA